VLDKKRICIIPTIKPAGTHKPRKPASLKATLFTLAFLFFATAASIVCAGGGVGTGTLQVYVDSERTVEAPENQAHNYIVMIQTTYYYRIAGITEFAPGQTIQVQACYKSETANIGTYTIQPDGTIEFEWTIPNLRENTHIKYKYGTSLLDWNYAKKTTHGIALTMAVPIIPLGILGSISAPLVAFAVHSIRKKKHLQ